MKSSSGEHFIALDHIRAIAALMVFTWHFTHGSAGIPVTFDYYPSLFPLSLLDEGHTGVALFMTLSGYLFAKLLDGKTIDYKAFLWNRALRLLPLLAVVLFVTGVYLVVRGKTSLSSYASTIATGLLLPSLPNGGWSITVEFHFYVILPLFLWMLRRSRWLPLSIILTSVTLRTLIHQETGEVQSLGYWTIIGRIDQFALGMLAFQFRSRFAHRHVLSIMCLTAFSLFYWSFDVLGGFMTSPSYPSPSWLWILLPTIEGVGYAIGIAWYDTSFSPSTKGFSRYVGYAGAYSYSIYLLHYNFVFRAAGFINEHIMEISNFYLACAWSVFCFLLMIPIGYLSFRYIEQPFLNLRRQYVTTPLNETAPKKTFPQFAAVKTRPRRAANSPLPQPRLDHVSDKTPRR
jgi:Predicted acyltransferases